MQTLYIAPTAQILANGDITLPFKIDQIVSGVRLEDSGAAGAIANVAVAAEAKGAGNATVGDNVRLQAGGLTARHGTQLENTMSLVLVVSVQGEHVRP